MKIKELSCNIKAVPFFIKTGIWVPHLYEEVETHKGIVIADDNSFHESDSLQHTADERVYMNATITTMKCVYCNKEFKCWYYKEPVKI